MFQTLVKFSRNGIIPNIKKISGAQLIYNKLVEHNIKDVFLYSGGSIMPLVDKFYKNDIKYYINTHEQNCGHSATGYAKSSGNLGVVITTSGPGLTNLITPILDAQNDSTPLLVLSGQVGLKNMGTCAFQEAPSVDITKAITKFSYCLKTTEEIPEIMDKAIDIAMNGKKGVVHIDIPKCISTNEIYTHYTYFKNSNFKKDKFDKNNFNNIVEVINNSNKPVFYIGQGAKNASKELYECIKKVIYLALQQFMEKEYFPNMKIYH